MAKAMSKKIEEAEPAKAVIAVTETGLQVIEKPQLYLSPVMNLDTAKRRLQEFQQFVKFYLHEGVDYGTIPGSTKPVLLKPGADKLSELYGLAPTFPDERAKRTENWAMEPPLFDYEFTCVLLIKSTIQILPNGKVTGVVAGEGLGSCNSWETKYRWREQSRSCPVCGRETIIKGKQEYGGGWLCFQKKGGCGAKFADADPKIIDQPVGRVVNDSVADLKNTVLKIGKKRAMIDAVIAATGSSGIFTQDLEHVQEPEPAAVSGNGTKPEPRVIEASSPYKREDIEEAVSQLDQMKAMPAAAAPVEDMASLEDHKEWLRNCRKLDELTNFFRIAYKQFASNEDAQRQLREIYEPRKVELGGAANPKGETNKTRRKKNGTPDRN